MTDQNTQSPLKVPPHSFDAERSTLGSILIDQQAIIKIADLLMPDDFYYDNHRLIFDVMLDLYHRHSPIDLVTLSALLKDKGVLEGIGGNSALTDLTEAVVTAAHILEYAQIVKQKATLRKLIVAGGAITALGYNEIAEIENLLEDAEKSLFTVSQTFLKERFVHIKEILMQTYEKISDLHDPEGQQKYRGIPTGFRSLDMMLSGLHASDLVVIAARPSMGKTALALNIAQHVARGGKSVGVMSLEMSKEQLVERLFCALLAVDSWKMRTGRLTEEDFARIGPIMDELNSSKIFIDDTLGNSIPELRAKARRLQMEHGLDVLIVDYLQLMSTGAGGGGSFNRVQEIGEISRALKGLARELHIPVIALSQLSRAVELRPSKIPQLSDLRESGCLTGDTLLTRGDTGERVQIKDLVGKTDIPIFSIGADLKLKIQKISKVFFSGYKQIYALKTRSGRLIKASGNHPFLTVSGWQPVEKLKRGAHVALPRKLFIPHARSSLTDYELILLAHLIGDGCVLPTQPIHYTSGDQKNIKIVARAAVEAFQITPRIVRQKNWWHVYLPTPYRLARGRHNPITAWYKKLGIKPVRSYEKEIPNVVFSSSPAQIRLFLHHLWATDGNISWKKLKGRKLGAVIYYATTSQRLAEQVQALLLRLGILSTKRFVPQKHHRPNYQIHIQGSAQQILFCTLVGSYGLRGEIVPEMIAALEKIIPNPNQDSIPKEIWKTLIDPVRNSSGVSWRALSEKIHTAYCGSTLLKSGLSRERLSRMATALQSNPIVALAQSDIYWDEIMEITSLGVEPVFDATVPETHNFIANDFIVHNSIEQDSDVVLMMYREDYYEEDTDRVGITDIFIRKHRNGPTGHVELMFKKEQMRFYDVEKQRKPGD